MDYYIAGIPYSAELYHHGIKGQKWGIRRYQNLDGSLTAEGKAKYGTVENFQSQMKNKGPSSKNQIKANKFKNTNNVENNKENRNKNVKKALKVGAAVAATALVAYGAYKLTDKSVRSYINNTSEKMLNNALYWANDRGNMKNYDSALNSYTNMWNKSSTLGKFKEAVKYRHGY